MIPFFRQKYFTIIIKGAHLSSKSVYILMNLEFLTHISAVKLMSHLIPVVPQQKFGILNIWQEKQIFKLKSLKWKDSALIDKM